MERSAPDEEAKLWDWQPRRLRVGGRTLAKALLPAHECAEVHLEEDDEADAARAEEDGNMVHNALDKPRGGVLGATFVEHERDDDQDDVL